MKKKLPTTFTNSAISGATTATNINNQVGANTSTPGTAQDRKSQLKKPN